MYLIFICSTICNTFRLLPPSISLTLTLIYARVAPIYIEIIMTEPIITSKAYWPKRTKWSVHKKNRIFFFVKRKTDWTGAKSWFKYGFNHFELIVDGILFLYIYFLCFTAILSNTDGGSNMIFYIFPMQKK